MGAGVKRFFDRATGLLGAGGDRDRDEDDLLRGEREPGGDEEEESLPELVLDRAGERWRRRLAEREEVPLLLALLGAGEGDRERDFVCVRFDDFLAGDRFFRAGAGGGDLLLAAAADVRLFAAFGAMLLACLLCFAAADAVDATFVFLAGGGDTLDDRLAAAALSGALGCVLVGMGAVFSAATRFTWDLTARISAT